MSPIIPGRVKLKPVCLLLGLCHVGSAAAIGLGEISVRSYLGQALHATVALIDAPATTSADCLSVGVSQDGIAPLSRPRLSIDRSAESTMLHIRTSEPIHDPVVQFVLRSDCETRIQREYVVLLDPPEFAAVVTPVPDEPATAEAVAAETRPSATSRQACRTRVRCAESDGSCGHATQTACACRCG